MPRRFPYIDVTAVEMLAGISEELGARGVGLAMARDVEQIQEVLKTAGAPPGLRHLYTTVDAAVKGLRKEQPAPAELRRRLDRLGEAEAEVRVVLPLDLSVSRS